MRFFIRLFPVIVIAGFMLASCEGPMGPKGDTGQDGTNASETCKICHNNSIVVAKAIEYEHSLHFTGEAFEEGTRTNCAPCHSHQGFLHVVKNSTPVTFVPDPLNTGKYLNNYIIPSSSAVLPGAISCFTCHSSLHTDYEADEFSPLTTTASVPMTMYGGNKTINFAQTSSNLCAKCHQPRPITASSGNLIDYSLLTSAPATNYSLSSVSYRTGVHYGTSAAMAAGVGGIEFGTGYSNTVHTTLTSCTDCHMSTPSGLSGGHSFNAAGNYASCNVSGCHSAMNSTTAGATTSYITTKLAELATKINAIGSGHDILQKDPTDNQYHGYFDIYDASSNPTGYWKNPAYGTPAFPTLTNAQFGAILNYQLVMRDGSLGIHNPAYMKKLLENTLAAW